MPKLPDGFAPFTGVVPFCDFVGPFARNEDGALGIHADERHVNSFGKVQGGLLATMVDYAIGQSLRDAHEDEIAAATVSLTVDYLGSADQGDWIQSSTRVEKLGRSLAFVDCSLSAGEREIVRGRAVFAVR